MTSPNKTSLEWKKLNPKEGDKHHWYADLFPLDCVFNIYEIEGKYALKITWEELTKDIGWSSTLDAAKEQAENHMAKSLRSILEWISS